MEEKTSDKGKVNSSKTETTPSQPATPSQTTKPSQSTTPSKPVHTHSYSSSVTKTATCTTNGIKTYKCSCGDSYTESIPAKEHNFLHFTLENRATCTQSGTDVYRCIICGYKETRVTPATGHYLMDDFDTVTINTCTQDGLRVVKRCSWCDYKETEIIPAGHRFVVDGRCTSCGMEVQ